MNHIPVNFDVHDVPQDFKNLFRNYADLTLADLQRSATLTWGNGIDTEGNFNHIVGWKLIQIFFKTDFDWRYLVSLSRTTLRLRERKN